MALVTHMFSALPLCILLPLPFNHTSRSFCSTSGNEQDSSPYREPCEDGSKKLLFGSGKDDSSPNGNSGLEYSKTLLFGSANSYNEIYLCYYDTSNKQTTCYGICNTALNNWPFNLHFYDLVPPRSSSILFSCLCLALPSVLFFQVFQLNIV
jgi:hypothetical protein